MVSWNVNPAQASSSRYFIKVVEIWIRKNKLKPNKLKPLTLWTIYGLSGNIILHWFKYYVSGRQQHVLLSGAIQTLSQFNPAFHKDLHINHLPTSISSPFCWRFLVYWQRKVICSCQFPWAQTWRLKFNASKCKVLSITKRRPLVADYVINGKTLEHVTSQKDLLCHDLVRMENTDIW